MWVAPAIGGGSVISSALVWNRPQWRNGRSVPGWRHKVWDFAGLLYAVPYWRPRFPGSANLVMSPAHKSWSVILWTFSRVLAENCIKAVKRWWSVYFAKKEKKGRITGWVVLLLENYYKVLYANLADDYSWHSWSGFLWGFHKGSLHTYS